MNFRLAVLLWLLQYSSAQDSNCDYYQYVQPGVTYSLNSPNYPRNYSRGIQCRWIADCPPGYNCRLYCSLINIPQSPSCDSDRMLVSTTGDPQLAGADKYCGRGSLTAVSRDQRLSIGLVSATYSNGGTFTCQLTAQTATPAPQCRCGEKRMNRIVGGEETAVNEFKMLVGLAEVAIAQIKCGAVIISEFYVMSAAHCVYRQPNDKYAVVVGEHNTTIGDSPATRAYAIARIITHPQYTESNYDYDLAIIKTQVAIEFNDRVGPVCLPFKFLNTDFTGKKVTIVGWGTLFPGGPTSKVPRKVDLDVISQSSCRSQVPSVTDRQMCTYTPGKDSCQDDSGGPLLYSDPATGLFFGIGVISYGRFCASNYPGVNTRVTALLSWITNTTQTSYCIK